MQSLIAATWLSVLMPVLISAAAWGIAVWALRQPDAGSDVVRRLIRGYDRDKGNGAVPPIDPNGRPASKV